MAPYGSVLSLTADNVTAEFMGMQRGNGLNHFVCRCRLSERGVICNLASAGLQPQTLSLTPLWSYINTEITLHSSCCWKPCITSALLSFFCPFLDVSPQNDQVWRKELLGEHLQRPRGSSPHQDTVWWVSSLLGTSTFKELVTVIELGVVDLTS